jgi:hypothetical protein
MASGRGSTWISANASDQLAGLESLGAFGAVLLGLAAAFGLAGFATDVSVELDFALAWRVAGFASFAASAVFGSASGFFAATRDRLPRFGLS